MTLQALRLFRLIHFPLIADVLGVLAWRIRRLVHHGITLQYD